MADIRCSHCGNNNPDFFDTCQFCQSPLKSESMLHAGDEPQKVDTGDLEPILPDWLQDARQQNRNAAAEEAVKESATKPRVQNAPLDLLAGLASQAESDDDDVPDWLSSINPVAKQTPSMPPSTQGEESSDFFSQFSQGEAQPVAPSASEPEKPPKEAGKKKQGQTDQLNNWLSPGSAESREPVGFEPDAPVADDSNSWMNNFESFNAAEPEKPIEKESEDLGWLHNLEATSKQTGDLPSSQQETGFDFGSLQSDSSQEDLGWLNNLGGTPAPSANEPTPSQPASSQDDMSWLDNLGGTSSSLLEETSPSQSASSQDDMSWLNNLGGAPVSSFEETSSSQSASSQEDMSWLNNLGGTSEPAEEAPLKQPASSQEDLSWLNNFGDTSASSFEEPAPSQPASSQEDLSWLNNLGGTPEPAEEAPSEQPASSQGDMGWLSDLGGTPARSFEEPSQPVSSQEDLSWLNNFGGTPAPSFEEPAPSQPASSQEDLSWLNNLGGTEEAASPDDAVSTFSSQDDSDWMKNLGAQEDTPPSEVTQYTPRGTAPLSENAGKDSTPDWLKSAMEEPSMPAPGDLSMDWLTSHEKTDQDVAPLEDQFDETNASFQREPVTEPIGFDLPFSDTSSESSQDVDSLFNVDMPDWMSQESAGAESSQRGYEQTSGEIDESLAPVELPSWVQAMRPVDSAIRDMSASDADQVTERDGPLAGFSGVIPFAQIGSSLRPKAFSMKLQVTEEQQAGAVLMEQIINSETLALPSKSTALVASQRALRWILTGLFLVVLGAVIGLGVRTMPIFASATMNELSNLISALPENSPVLVVVDYEPSLSGELEVIASPVLDQLAVARRSKLTFVSMSPNGSGLADRLINLNDGLSEVQYSNLGFLPGGSAGVLGFIENPRNAMPKVTVDGFSNFEVVIILTDNVESGRVWVEQLEFAKSKDPIIASKPLIVVSSAQAGPMIRPYLSSGQVDIMLSGLSDAAQYEYVNNTRLSTARSYWDAFDIGLALAAVSIILGSLWSLFIGIRERRTEVEQG